jgi:hypothetical protein
VFSSFLFLYAIGMLWSMASWMRQIHEYTSAANMCSSRRTEKNRENALRKSARETFKEGIWCVPFWPILIVRNLSSVIVVAKECWLQSKNETRHRQ